MSAPALVVAVSSRALFDFEAENEIFKSEGSEAYVKAQREKLDEVAADGVAVPLIRKLLALNEDSGENLVQVVVVSRNDPVTGLRVFRSIEESRLEIRRGCFTRGAAPYKYLPCFGAHLFLSADANDVRQALKETGVPSAHVRGGRHGGRPPSDKVLRIAFDGDSVLFGDESERVNYEQGLSAFRKLEEDMRDKPLEPGPFKPFFDALSALRRRLPDSSRIRTTLITARGGAPEKERVTRTFMDWGVEVDETFFMDGQSKHDIIETFGADMFFDDSVKHVKGVWQGGHVPSGPRNE